MEVVFPRCAGLDVHKKTVVACVLIHEGSERIREIRTFGTTTTQLHALREMRVTQVAMESTGSYWKPVFNLLEDDGTPWVINPAHIKQVPGRKTDGMMENTSGLCQNGCRLEGFVFETILQRKICMDGHETPRHRRVGLAVVSGRASSGPTAEFSQSSPMEPQAVSPIRPMFVARTTGVITSSHVQHERPPLIGFR